MQNIKAQLPSSFFLNKNKKNYRVVVVVIVVVK
jgi:hypothetical protein